jgi:hypothetical protein
VSLIHETANKVFTSVGNIVGYKVGGTMIEIPRAALVADKVSNG